MILLFIKAKIQYSKCYLLLEKFTWSNYKAKHTITGSYKRVGMFIERQLIIENNPKIFKSFHSKHLHTIQSIWKLNDIPITGKCHNCTFRDIYVQAVGRTIIRKDIQIILRFKTFREFILQKIFMSSANNKNLHCLKHFQISLI